MAETTQVLPSPILAHGMYVVPATKVVDASEVDYSTPLARCIHNTLGVNRIAMFLKFANYTSVSVKLQRSYDYNGTTGTWVDIPSGELTTSATHLVVSPVAPWVQVLVDATLSGSTDTLEVWLHEEYGPPIG